MSRDPVGVRPRRPAKSGRSGPGTRLGAPTLDEPLLGE
jgi:hypothetical protein